MDKNGLDVYRQVINIIETAMHLGLSGVTLIQLSRDKICFVRKTEYQDVLNYAMNFFLENPFFSSVDGLFFRLSLISYSP